MGASTVEVRRRIAAAPATIFPLVSDPVEMAQWHPSFDRVAWLDGADRAEKGARFQVHNIDARFEWSIDDCVVIENDGASAFAIVFVVGDREAALQRFRLHPDGAVTEVTATYERRWEPLPDRIRGLWRDRDADARRGLEVALEGLERASLVRAGVA